MKTKNGKKIPNCVAEKKSNAKTVSKPYNEGFKGNSLLLGEQK
ncbi:hypothetical protein Q0590_32895 [Rhodocytophaga aerolata]|uniref:Uncharacterized protein n=1 Tax=Rhodocytophaga aerolata TaxID=455078 RepID=A0ABT8RIX6_9BACT|nr:hypothetical protein [Rhodocytophaga aerolata]MDO1451118.1 hypothetical protein [Rhodocytophaga aerolata]